MTIQEQNKLNRECDIFCGSALGKTAVPKFGETYKVTGTYLDSNGCMKTHGSGYQESFINSTDYID